MPVLARDHDARAAGALSRHRRRRADARAAGLLRLGPAGAAGVQRLRAGGDGGRRRGLPRLYRRRCSFSVSTRSRSGSAGPSACSPPASCSCRICARPAPTRCRAFSATASARAALRMAASVLQLPPTALLLAAEIKIAALIASLFLPLSFSFAVLLLVALVAAIAILGGMRSRDLDRKRPVHRRRGRPGGGGDHRVGAAHQSAGAATDLWRDCSPPCRMPRSPRVSRRCSPNELATALPGAAPMPIVKPFLQPFGIARRRSTSSTLFLCLALGTAALPSLLVRSGVTSSIADQRRSSGVGPPVRGAVRHDGAGHGGVRQADHLPRHRAGAGVVATGVAHRAQPTSTCCKRPTPTATARSARPSCSIARDGIALVAAGGGGAPLRADRADGDRGAWRSRSRRRARISSPWRRAWPKTSTACSTAATALPRLIAAWAAIAASALAAAVFLVDCRPRPAPGGADGVRLRWRDLLPRAAARHLVAALHQVGRHGGAGRRLCRHAGRYRVWRRVRASARPASPPRSPA